MNSFINTMNNVTYTENDALTNKSSMSKIVDFFFHGAALRNETDENRILKLFQDAFDEDPQTALRILFYIRDVRGGQGERKVFRTIMRWLGTSNSTNSTNIKMWLADNIHLIPEYGRWDDLFVFIGTNLQHNVLEYIKHILRLDLYCLEKNKSVSLLAKWLPSENASSSHNRQLARLIAAKLGYTPRIYRKTLSKLRAHIDVVERRLSAKDFKRISYATVPSKAGLLYKKAFMKHDEEGYTWYLKQVEDGKVNINTSTLYPYDILRQYFPNGDTNLYSYDRNIKENQTIELMWKNLPDYVPDLCGLVVADTSGSMCGNPMLVSISLAMYIAERNKNEAWKDYFISFSERPKFHKIEGDNLFKRAKSVALGDIANTNLQAVFDLILDRARINNVSKEDMPKVIIIVSDMEFDSCTYNSNKTNFETIKDNYRFHGYNMPTLIFWNVDSRKTQSPITINDNGVVLLSGCSPSVFKYALGTCKTPLDLVYNVTNSDRYNKINWNNVDNNPIDG